MKLQLTAAPIRIALVLVLPGIACMAGCGDAGTTKEDAGPPESTPRVAAAVTEQPSRSKASGSQGEALERVWGAQWERVASRYEKAGIDLSHAVTFPPWEQVEGRVRDEFLVAAETLEELVRENSGWPAEPTAGEIARLLGRDVLGAEELDRALDAAAPLHEEIDAQARIYADMVAEARRQLWERDDFTRSPLIGVPAPDRAQTLLHGGFISVDGWNVIYKVWADDFPWLVEQRSLLKRLVRERLAAMRAAVEG